MRPPTLVTTLIGGTSDFNLGARKTVLFERLPDFLDVSGIRVVIDLDANTGGVVSGEDLASLPAVITLRDIPGWRQNAWDQVVGRDNIELNAYESPGRNGLAIPDDLAAGAGVTGQLDFTLRFQSPDEPGKDCTIPSEYLRNAKLDITWASAIANLTTINAASRVRVYAIAEHSTEFRVPVPFQVGRKTNVDSEGQNVPAGMYRTAYLRCDTLVNYSAIASVTLDANGVSIVQQVSVEDLVRFFAMEHPGYVPGLAPVAVGDEHREAEALLTRRWIVPIFYAVGDGKLSNQPRSDGSIKLNLTDTMTVRPYWMYRRRYPVTREHYGAAIAIMAARYALLADAASREGLTVEPERKTLSKNPVGEGDGYAAYFSIKGRAVLA